MSTPSFASSDPFAGLFFDGTHLFADLTLATANKVEDDLAAVKFHQFYGTSSVTTTVFTATMIRDMVDKLEVADTNLRFLIPNATTGTTIHVQALEEYTDADEKDLGSKYSIVYDAPAVPIVVKSEAGTIGNSATSGKVTLTGHQIKIYLNGNNGGGPLAQYSVFKSVSLNGVMNTVTQVFKHVAITDEQRKAGFLLKDLSTEDLAEGSHVSYFATVDNGAKESAMSSPVGFILSTKAPTPVLDHVISGQRSDTAGELKFTAQVSLPADADNSRWTVAYLQKNLSSNVTVNWVTTGIQITKDEALKQIPISGNFLITGSDSSLGNANAFDVYDFRVVLGGAGEKYAATLAGPESSSNSKQALSNVCESGLDVDLTNVLTNVSGTQKHTWTVDYTNSDALGMEVIEKIVVFKNNIQYTQRISTLAANVAMTPFRFDVALAAANENDMWRAEVSLYRSLGYDQAKAHAYPPPETDPVNGNPIITYRSAVSDVVTRQIAASSVPLLADVKFSEFLAAAASQCVLTFVSPNSDKLGGDLKINSVNVQISTSNDFTDAASLLMITATGGTQKTIIGPDVSEFTPISRYVNDAFLGYVLDEFDRDKTYYGRVQLLVNQAGVSGAFAGVWQPVSFHTSHAPAILQSVPAISKTSKNTFELSFAPSGDKTYDYFLTGSNTAKPKSYTIKLVNSLGEIVESINVPHINDQTDNYKQAFTVTVGDKYRVRLLTNYMNDQQQLVKSHEVTSNELIFSLPPIINSIDISEDATHYTINATVDLRGESSATAFVIMGHENAGGSYANYSPLSRDGTTNVYRATLKKHMNYILNSDRPAIVILYNEYGESIREFP